MTKAREWKSTFRVGFRKCTITLLMKKGTSPILKTDWEPSVPEHDLGAQEISQYRAGRDALLAEVSNAIGTSALVIET